MISFSFLAKYLLSDFAEIGHEDLNFFKLYSQIENLSTNNDDYLR